MSHPDDSMSEDEIREAAALAAALEGSDSATVAPGDALEVATMLHATRNGALLDDVTQQAVLERVMKQQSGAVTSIRKPRRARNFVFVAVGGALAMAAAAILSIRQASPVVAPASVALDNSTSKPLTREAPIPPAPESFAIAFAAAHVGMTDAEVAAIDVESQAYRRRLLLSASVRMSP